MSDDKPQPLACPKCDFQAFNAPHLHTHIYERHELPDQIPADHESKVQLETAYYYHVVPGQCDRHERTRVLCIHSAPDNKVGDLKLYCLACLGVK